MLKDKIKIIFFDIDGTLIDTQKEHITENTLNTLKKLKENDIKICIATGRPPTKIPKFEGVEFDAYLTFNGSYCFSGNDEIHSNPISQMDAKRIVDNATKINRPVSIATKTKVIANGEDEDLVQYFAFAKQNIKIDKNFYNVLENEDVYQFMISALEKDYEDIVRYTDNAKITYWWPRAVDVIPADSGKSIGVEKILKYFNLDKSQAMAFGDGNNDLDMIAAVGNGIAMGNASEDLKKIAKDICGDVSEDGIYHYCIEHGLI